MTSQPGKQTITIHILTLNISRRRDKQRMEFGQLIDTTRETFFLKNHTQHQAEKLFPDLSLKNQN